MTPPWRFRTNTSKQLNLNDSPDLVVIQVYITSANRAYRLADHYRERGAFVVLGGLHVTSLPDEAAAHADTIFVGPGEDTWPAFLADFRNGSPQRIYLLQIRTLDGVPPIRRDLIKRRICLVPNSIVVSRGCPHVCDFCYKEAFFEGGRSFYTQTVDAALAEIERLPGRHLYFLDDHLFGDRRFATALFDGMRGMGRLWQAAGTANAVLAPRFTRARGAVWSPGVSLSDSRRLTRPTSPSSGSIRTCGGDYAAAIRRLHDLGVMINGSFVFGMHLDDCDVFDSELSSFWSSGYRMAAASISTPYPAWALYQRMAAQQRLTIHDWDLYDTRHAVFRPARMSAEQLESGYNWAYREFYRWGSIARGAAAHDDPHVGFAPYGVLTPAGINRTAVGFRHPREASRNDASGTEAALSEFGRRSSGSIRSIDERGLNNVNKVAVHGSV